MLKNCYKNAKIYKSHDLAVREENLTSKKMKKRDVNYDDLKKSKVASKKLITCQSKYFQQMWNETPNKSQCT